MQKMVKCKACGADIAKTANRCPKCGAQQHIAALTAVAIIVVLTVFAVFWILLF